MVRGFGKRGAVRSPALQKKVLINLIVTKNFYKSKPKRVETIYQFAFARNDFKLRNFRISSKTILVIFIFLAV